MSFRKLVFAALGLLPVAACSAAGSHGFDGQTESADGGPLGPGADGGRGFSLDGSSDAAYALDPDAACATAVEQATPVQLPVDILWMVDNSSSMQPAVTAVTQGLNAFASTIAAKSLDYRVIMLSLRSKTSPIQVNGNTRYPICIPQPLAGDDNCGNSPTFFQSSIDILSTQPLEQLLGTLDQTTGYQPGDTRGGEPWKQALRANATKTIVVVTDDNSRLSAADFETFKGGPNPGNPNLTLPPGILDPSRNGEFDGYVFASIYGWGSASDPNVSCTYANGTKPPSSGPVYTTLVGETMGPRAKICDAAGAWSSFFDAVAQAVVQGSKVSCEIPIPMPASGTLDPSRVNVRIGPAGTSTVIPKVANAGACANDVAWYYDDDAHPMHVELCPAACAEAQGQVGTGKSGRVEVLFGCQTILR